MDCSCNDALVYRRFGEPRSVLSLERQEISRLAPGMARVRMMRAPINPSDLIPIRGSYRSRIPLPQVAGYEGIGEVVETCGDARRWLGRRVLPLRSGGTWQRYVDTDLRWLVPVPDDIATGVAARAYINPLTARLALQKWPVHGRVVLVTAAGSFCAGLIAQWALMNGARSVTGIRRSAAHDGQLKALGVEPLDMVDNDQLRFASREADIVFDAVGGALADTILAGIRPGTRFISYGLLSAVPIKRPCPPGTIQQFRLRDHLGGFDTRSWQEAFDDIWCLLRRSTVPGISGFQLQHWREALSAFERPGRLTKPLLQMDVDA